MFACAIDLKYCEQIRNGKSLRRKPLLCKDKRAKYSTCFSVCVRVRVQCTCVRDSHELKFFVCPILCNIYNIKRTDRANISFFQYSKNLIDGCHHTSCNVITISIVIHYILWEMLIPWKLHILYIYIHIIPIKI